MYIYLHTRTPSTGRLLTLSIHVQQELWYSCMFCVSVCVTVFLPSLNPKLVKQMDAAQHAKEFYNHRISYTCHMKEFEHSMLFYAESSPPFFHRSTHTHMDQDMIDLHAMWHAMFA